jgi:predicted nucleotidyltransferase
MPTTRAELTASHQHLIEELTQRYVPCVRAALELSGGLSFIILYGSRARGTYNWTSDVDLLICGSAFENTRVIDRALPLAKCQLSAAVEEVCYTPEEAVGALARRSLTLLECLYEGVVLYQSGPLLGRLQEEFAALVESGKIRREGGTGPIKWRLQR